MSNVGNNIGNSVGSNVGSSIGSSVGIRTGSSLCQQSQRSLAKYEIHHNLT